MMSAELAMHQGGCEEGSYSLPMWLVTGISGTLARVSLHQLEGRHRWPGLEEGEDIC